MSRSISTNIIRESVLGLETYAAQKGHCIRMAKVAGPTVSEGVFPSFLIVFDRVIYSEIRLLEDIA